MVRYDEDDKEESEREETREEDASSSTAMEIEEIQTEPVEASTVTTKKKGRGKGKGKRGPKRGASSALEESYSSSGAKGLSRIREQARCGSCGNPMTMTKNINVQPLTGIKVPKDKEGKYKISSPGAEEGKLSAVLCDDCVDKAQDPRYNKIDGSSSVDIKTAVIERDNKIVNVSIEDLKNNL